MDDLGKFLGHTPEGVGLATTAILAALLDRLVETQIFERREIVSILENARVSLNANRTAVAVIDAMDIVSKLAKRFKKHTRSRA